MSKTVEWGINDKQHQGIIKIIGLLLNMIQESDSQGKIYLGDGNRTIEILPMEIYDKIRVIQTKGVYNEEEQKYLNTIRHLVLDYKKQKEKEKFLDELPFFINSRGILVNKMLLGPNYTK
jgi:hypothetical protein